MDWSYVACYLDCEGTVGLWKNGSRPRSKVVSLTWYNSDMQSLQAMRDFMGVGRVRPSTQSVLGTKPRFELALTSKEDILFALNNMIPNMHIKKNAAIALRQHLLDNVDSERGKQHGVLLAVSEEDYRRWYHEEGKSLAEIAAMFNATPSGVLRLFKVYGIERRSHAGTRKGKPKSEETKAKMRASRSQLWADPAFREQQIANMKAGRAASGYRVSATYTKPAIQGERHPRSKLTNAQTAAIRERYATGTSSLQQLADEYHVSKKTILNIVRERIWQGVSAVASPYRLRDAAEVSKVAQGYPA